LPNFINAQWVVVGSIIILAILLLGIFFVQKESNKMSIQSRKNWSIIFFWVLLTACIPFLSVDFRYWVLCLLPIAAFVAASFYYINDKRIKSFLHWAFFLFAIFVNYFLQTK
jgi:hypothetical protein